MTVYGGAQIKRKEKEREDWEIERGVWGEGKNPMRIPSPQKKGGVCWTAPAPPQLFTKTREGEIHENPNRAQPAVWVRLSNPGC